VARRTRIVSARITLAKLATLATPTAIATLVVP